MEEIEHLCDRIALIDKGDVVEHGKVDDILSKHAQSALYMEGDDVQMDWFKEVGSCKRHHNGILIENNETLHAMEQVLMILKEKRGFREPPRIVETESGRRVPETDGNVITGLRG